MARTRKRAAFIHRVRLVLDKLTKQKLRNFDPLRMVTASSWLVVCKSRIEKQLSHSLLSNCQIPEKLSVNFNVNKVVARSEHESSVKPESIGERMYLLLVASITMSNNSKLKGQRL